MIFLHELARIWMSYYFTNLPKAEKIRVIRVNFFLMRLPYRLQLSRLFCKSLDDDKKDFIKDSRFK
jgi:hypothetical protein